MTPIQYAKKCIADGKFPSMTIIPLCGSFYLGDNDYNMLKGKTYATKDQATRDRSKILDRASKTIKL